MPDTRPAPQTDGADVSSAEWSRATLENLKVGLASSPTLRRGPASPFARLMRELGPILSRCGAEVFAVEGAMRTIVEYGLLRDIPDSRLHCMPGGHRGGLVDLGAAVVGRDVAGLGGSFGDNCEGVREALELRVDVNCFIYLVDPRDVTSTLADTAALKRECVVRKTPFLATIAAATGWLNLLATSAGYHEEFIDRDLATSLRWDGFPRRAIALVAHNEKKHDMLEFVSEHLDFLDEFRQRIGTGTTASLINGRFPDSLVRELEEAEAVHGLFTSTGRTPPALLEERLDELTRTLAGIHRKRGGSSDSKKWVDELNSGPKGGDLQAGEAILMGLCDAILFFEDPLSPHEHDADIEVFERAARLSNRRGRDGHEGHGVMCLHEPTSAGVWATLQGEAGCHAPITLAAAFQRKWGVNLVTPPKLAAPGAESWKLVAEEAVWYLINAIVAGERVRAEKRDTLRVALLPGGAIREIIERIGDVVGHVSQRAVDLHERLEGRLKAATELCRTDDEQKVVSEIIDRRRLLETFTSDHGKALPRCWECSEVRFAPSTGAFGATDPATEANAHARSLADLFGGDVLQLAQSPLIRRSSGGSRHKQVPDNVSEHWQRCDIVVMACGDLPSTEVMWRGEGPPMPRGLYQEMQAQHAVGDVGGVFVADQMKDGFPVSPTYDRVGISPKQIKGIVRKAHALQSPRDAILIGNVEPDGRRLNTIVAALNARLLSTLITDRHSATKILEKVVADELAAAGAAT